VAEKRNFNSEALQYSYDRFIAGDAEQENATNRRSLTWK